MLQWLTLGMVYLGSLIMVYNICGFVRFARYVKKLDSWDANNYILHIPIILLVCFLLGYLAVGMFGKPDLIVAGILFGGSIFVFVMYKLLSGITQRIVASERLEAQLLAAEESNRAKSRFLATMSHEMRTPLNAVIGLDALALQDQALTPQTRERLEKMDISAHHLLDMINDVLDMNHIESGNMQLKAEPFAPADVLNLVNVLARMLCEEKGLDYRHEVVGELRDTCIGDSLRLRQVLLSILDKRGEVHARGRHRSASSRSSCPGRGALRTALHHQRHRHRYRRGLYTPDVRLLLPGGRYRHQPLRRQRPGPGDHQKAGGHDGRRNRR